MESAIEMYNEDCIEGMQKLEKKTADLIFADPPYNLSNNVKTTVQSGKRVVCNKGKWDYFEDMNEFEIFTASWIKEAKRVLKPHGIILVTGTYHVYPIVGRLFLRNFNFINDIIWYKPNATPLLAANRLAQKTETILVATPKKGKFYFDYKFGQNLNGGKQLSNLWEIPATEHKTSNPCEKPESLMERILLLFTRPNDLVIDPFMGGGTTAVLCKRLGRKCITFESDPEMFKEGRKRVLTTQINPKIEEMKKKSITTIDRFVPKSRI